MSGAVDLEELQAKAALALAPKEMWCSSICGRYTDGWWSTGRIVQSKQQAEEDRDHIAANSPATTIALITRIRNLELALRSAAREMQSEAEYSFVPEQERRLNNAATVAFAVLEAKVSL